MNVQQGNQRPGQQFSGVRGAIINAKPLAEPEFITARKDVDEDLRALSVSSKDSSEFSPAKAIEFSAKTALDNLLFGSKEVSKGQINRGYLEPYMAASYDRSQAVRLKREVFIPILEEAFNRYKGLDDVNEIMDTVKQKLKAAIGMHIDLSAHRVIKRIPTQKVNQMNGNLYATAA
jgi:hypothetical protein